MAKASPIEFLREVKQEVAKVTWPTRKETTITATMVFIMVAMAALFFLAVDALLSWGVTTALGLGS